MVEITKIPPPLYSPESKGENDLDADQRERCYKAADALVSAFTWSGTAEGPEFWVAVRRRLLAISKGEALK